MYSKVSNDKTLFLTALKGIESENYKEDWSSIKLEELCIDRLLKRQEELVIVLDANNQVFLVNGFILSRLTNNSLKKSISKLRNEVSYIYKDIAQLNLKPDLISPISYCIAYDLLKRFEFHNLMETQKVKVIEENQKKLDEEKRLEFKEKREENSLNWIERRITSALIGISRPGISPNQFYWQEKDTKITSENIKIYSEVKMGAYYQICDFYEFCVGKIQSFLPEVNFPKRQIIEKEVSEIFKSILKERIGPSLIEADYEKILEGERYQIGMQIAQKIGKLLDKALYLKFKHHHRNS
ncbi:MAG: hypothetical protein ACFFKA_06865 [Candidatus Thorarchaeota archaeon]